jgi:hypothetical protein
MQITDLESDPKLQDLVLSTYHVSTMTFTFNPGVIKIIENHAGRGLGRVVLVPSGMPVIPRLLVSHSPGSLCFQRSRNKQPQ